MNQLLALGFDGGGTHTRAILLSANGHVLGVGQAGSSNVNVVGFHDAVENLCSAAHQAWAQSGENRRPANSAFLGLAGLEASGRAGELGSLLSDAMLVEKGRCAWGRDAEVALAGGLAGRPGMVLIAGTGSFCLGKDTRGHNHCAGGWGWLLDDVGGGTWLGREALRAVLSSEEGLSGGTSLTTRLLAATMVSAPGALISWLYARESRPSALAGLAPLVVEEASAGDPVALDILERGAAGLTRLVIAVSRRLDPESNREVVLTGGLARSGKPYQEMIERALHQSLPSLRLSAPEFSPVVGAGLLALQQLGRGLAAEGLTRLRNECAARGL